jgi:hypothetical protein
MLILALVLVGLVNVFVMSKSYIIHSRSRISASELGKEFLDPLQTFVNQSSWGANRLSVDGTYDPSNVTIDHIEFDPHYEFSAGPGDLRKVTVNITWDEPQTLF